MADKRDPAADSDKIKQLLAQLRAKFDMEDELGADDTEQEGQDMPLDDQAPTVSFPIVREGEGERKEEVETSTPEEVFPIGAVSNSFESTGTDSLEWERDDWQYVSTEEEQTSPQEQPAPFLNHDTHSTEVPGRTDEWGTHGSFDDGEYQGLDIAHRAPLEETVPFAHMPSGEQSDETAEEVEMNHADGEGFGDETLAFFLDRYAIAPKRGAKSADAQTPVIPVSKPAEQAKPVEENIQDRISVTPYRSAETPEKVPPVFPHHPAQTQMPEEQTEKMPDSFLQPDRMYEPTQRSAVSADFSPAEGYRDAQEAEEDDKGGATASPYASLVSPSAISAAQAAGEESPMDERDAPTDYGILPNPRPEKQDDGEFGHTLVFDRPKQQEPPKKEMPTPPPAPVMPEAEAAEQIEEQANPAQEATPQPTDAEPPKPHEEATPAPSPVPPVVEDVPPATKQEEVKQTPPQEQEKKQEQPPSSADRALFSAEKTRPEKSKKNKSRRSANDIEYNSRVQTEKVRRQLLKQVQAVRIRLIFAAVLAFALLWLENADYIGLPLPFFVQSLAVRTAVNAALLLSCILLSGKELLGGLFAFMRRRPLPSSMVVVGTATSFIYATAASVYGFLGGNLADIMLYSFVAALACVLLLCFEMVRNESRYASFCVLARSGDKLIFSLAPPFDAQIESNILGKKLGVDIPYIYRVRKTGFVDEFPLRTKQNCEDHELNFWLIVCAGLIGFVGTGIVGVVMLQNIWSAVGCGVLGLLVTLPFCACASHIFPCGRMTAAAGEDSAILGEKSAQECANLDAVEFEDIEAISSRNVRVCHIKMYAGNLDQVLYYVSSLLHLVGGPLRGYFSRSTKELGYSSDAVLTESVPGGLSATVDKANVLLGDGDYMQKNGIQLYFDPEDAHQIESGKICIMYAAINHKVCAKFYVQYMVSAAFERNVKRLSRHGIATIIRTYDPNISDRLLLRISAISDYRVHVVTKTVKQRRDFAAPHLTGGLVTTADTGKLLRLLFICLRTQRTIRAERGFKLCSLVLGCAVCLTPLFGWHALPSALFGLYHLLWLGFSLLWAVICIRPDVEKKKKKKKKENGGQK